jgi:hypothetical protein
MNTTKPELAHAPPEPATARAIASRRGSVSLSRPTWAELLDERMAMIGAPAFFGPPIIFVLGPWLLVVFLLIGPLALLLTGLLVMAAATGLLAVLAAVIASPYLLIRHLHARGRLRVEPRAFLHLVRTRRGGSRRPSSLQPKGTS